MSRYYLIRDCTVALAVLLAWYGSQTLGPPLWTEEEIYGANVWHPWFYTDAHYDVRYFRNEMTQRERVEGLSVALKAGLSGFAKLGVPAFLESSTLIGHLRHGGVIPWDTDADFGVLEEDCLRHGLTKEKVQAAMPSIEVVRFACQCDTVECVKDGERVLGLLTDPKTGSNTDIFMYRPPKQLRPWQNSSIDWLERSNDEHADFTFPSSVLLPLQTATYLNMTVFVPNAPSEFLKWEYGPCLGVHVAPYGVCVYSPTTAWGYWLLSLVELATSGSLYLVPGATLPAIVLELFGYSGVAAVVIILTRLTRPTMVSAAMITLALYDLRGCLLQLGCDAHANTFAPNPRPRTITICLFGTCFDFNIAATPLT